MECNDSAALKSRLDPTGGTPDAPLPTRRNGGIGVSSMSCTCCASETVCEPGASTELGGPDSASMVEPDPLTRSATRICAAGVAYVAELCLEGL